MARRDDDKGSEANKTRKRAQRRRGRRSTTRAMTPKNYEKSKDTENENEDREAMGQESTNNGKVTEMKINDVRQRRGGGSNNDARR